MHRISRFARPTSPTLLAGIIACLSIPGAHAAFPYGTTPSWESNPNAEVATGGAFGDLNRDGWLDMVVANGNDISRQRVTVYRNNGAGAFPANPTWSSTDIDYHGHLDLGDVNGDGWLDAVVAVYLGPGGFGDRGKVKLYLNDGAGNLSNSPSWESGDRFYSFSLALGDADGDGDLDLACACGDDYNDETEYQRIYYNIGGMFESLPSWTSADRTYALDVTWDDIDRDGDMEPLFCGTSAPLRYYRNDQTVGGGISPAASWQNTDLPEFGNTTALGDWNGDGFPELAVADNNQLGGAGRFKVYANSAGVLGTTPIWQSNNGGYGSNVTWVDLDRDGDQDLMTGRWFSALRAYENIGGTLTTAPIWTSGTSAVTENVFFGDVDRDGRRTNGLSVAQGTGSRTFFAIGQAPVESIDEVRIDGVPITGFVGHAANGWISVSPPPASGSVVEIAFSYSVDLDFGVTNWDSGEGNYLFLNTRTAAAVDQPLAGLGALGAYPNPMRDRTQIRYSGPALEDAQVDLFDVRGRRMRSLASGPVDGLRFWEWDGRDSGGRQLPAGTYFVRVSGRSSSVETRIVRLQ